MAPRRAEITTGREEKQEKEKVRNISQEIAEKSLVLVLNKSEPSHNVSSTSSKNASPRNLMTLDAKRQKSAPSP